MGCPPHPPCANPHARTCAQDLRGRTALHHAALRGHTGCVARLLAAGAAPDVRDEAKQTALGLAAAGGYLAVCQKLVAAGGSLDAQDAALVGGRVGSRDLWVWVCASVRGALMLGEAHAVRWRGVGWVGRVCVCCAFYVAWGWGVA